MFTTHCRGHRLPSVDDESFRVTANGPEHLRLPLVARADAICTACPAPDWPRLCAACSTGVAHAEPDLTANDAESGDPPLVWRCQDCNATGRD